MPNKKQVVNLKTTEVPYHEVCTFEEINKDKSFIKTSYKVTICLRLTSSSTHSISLILHTRARPT